MSRRPAAIRALVFDLGGVLVHFNAVEAARHMAEECHLPFTKASWFFFASPVQYNYSTGGMTFRDFFRCAKEELQIPADYQTFKRAWNDIFSRKKEMEELISQLRLNYPLYLISNTNPEHFEYIRRNFDILGYFERTFPSYRVGAMKPESRIYQAALNEMRLRPEETVFIDDVSKYVYAARKIGMHGIHFRHKDQLVRDLRKLGVDV